MIRAFALLASTVFIAAVQAGAVGAVAPVEPDAAAVLAEIKRQNLHAAANAYNALVEARLPASQSDRPDPVLDRLLVEQLVALGFPLPLPLAERLAGTASGTERAHDLLLLATAAESAADADEARRLYGKVLAAAAATPDQRLSAQLALARMTLGQDAGAALNLLNGIDTRSLPASRRWEVELQQARAIGIAQPANLAGQAERLAQAWAAAPEAAIADRAVARVANDIALAAGRAGDRSRMIAMLAVDRTNRLANNGQASAAAGLPLCGTHGIARDDVALVEVQTRAAPERPRVNLIWASRDGIGQVFLESVRRGGQLSVTDGAAASFALRCRVAPSEDFAVAQAIDAAVIGWMTGKGAYPLMSTDSTRNVSVLAADLAARTTRYGPKSIMRLPVLLQLLTCFAPLAGGDTDARARLKDIYDQITLVLEANAAPPELLFPWRLGASGMAVASGAISPAEGLTQVQTQFVQGTADRGLSRDLLYSVAMQLVENRDLPAEYRDGVLSATLKLFEKAPADDPQARALALRLYRVRAERGDVAGAAAALSGRNLPADLCIVANPAPRFVSSDIRGSDYPGDLVFAELTGLTPVEFDIKPDGGVGNGRILLGDPPYVFDDVARRGITTIRYDPPRRDGKPVGCRAKTQTVRWQMEQ